MIALILFKKLKSDMKSIYRSKESKLNFFNFNLTR